MRSSGSPTRPHQRAAAAPLTNKIREGLAKGRPAPIELVVRQMAMHLEAADQLIREMEPATEATGREAAVTLLAESWERRDIRRGPRPAATGAALSEVAADVRRNRERGKGPVVHQGREAPVPDATAVMAEAARQGFRSHEMLAIGREIKRRESDYREAARVCADSVTRLRGATGRIRLFRDRRADAVSRPAERPATQTPDRPTRPDVPRRPDQPERPTRPERTR